MVKLYLEDNNLQGLLVLSPWDTVVVVVVLVVVIVVIVVLFSRD